MTAQWRILNRSYLDDRHSTSVHVSVAVEDAPSAVEANAFVIGINERSRYRHSVIPHLLSVTYTWDDVSWVARCLYASNGGREMKVHPYHVTTPEWVRELVMTLLPTEQPGAWQTFEDTTSPKS